MRINFLLVTGKCFNGSFIQILHFGQTNAVLTGNNTTQFASQRHHLIHNTLSFMHHLIVVGVDWNISMHIAITSMHVGSRK